MAHKMGKSRYLGFGSLRFHILPESYLIDWNKRYVAESEEAWQEPIPVEGWLNPDVIAYYDDLRKALNAESI